MLIIKKVLDVQSNVRKGKCVNIHKDLKCQKQQFDPLIATGYLLNRLSATGYLFNPSIATGFLFNPLIATYTYSTY